MPVDVLAFADWVVETLAGGFAAAGRAATVTREYEVSFDTASMTGLHVNVFPVDYVREGPATRAEDNFDAEVVIVVAERYAVPGGKVPKAWLDERVGVVDQLIYQPLSQITQPLPLSEFWLQDIDVTTVYDLKSLREKKMFWSEIETTFRKLRR
ncbi:hypothetical protein [Gemmata sp.]|uniref:hypothetical protein n=1 Tax=Gemmata sp. TaxID=1914242 RepID=UPI003F70EED5